MNTLTLAFGSASLNQTFTPSQHAYLGVAPLISDVMIVSNLVDSIAASFAGNALHNGTNAISVQGTLTTLNLSFGGAALSYSFDIVYCASLSFLFQNADD